VIARVANGSPRVGITGVGAYAPERVLTNADVAQMVETSDAWIVERTGIRERHVAEPDEATSDVAVPAAREALERAGVAAEGVDLVLVATASPATIEQDLHYLQMNGREVYRFATRAMVSSAEQLLAECGLTVADAAVYVPRQANLRIIDHAARHLGLAPEKVWINVDRCGNTSSASVPICLHEALADGTLRAGQTVLMSAVEAGLSWGSALLVWGDAR